MTAANLSARYPNPTFDCGGAWVRSHFRHLATVVTVYGEIDAGNVERVTEHTRRFVLANDPLVIDLSAVDSIGAQGLALLHTIADDCRTAGVEWMLVASPAVAELLHDHDHDDMWPSARSVHKALHHFADMIDRRRQLLLPLVRKTA